MSVNKKLQNLKDYIKKLDSLLIAYSGGVDSTFLLKVAKDVLGEKVIAVTANSPTYSEQESTQAQKIAKAMKVKHITIYSRELELSEFTNNPPERCYFCKKELFKRLKEIAKIEGLSHVADGTNYDDTKDFRPGIRALKELGIKSPLKKVGFTKKEIRECSQKMGLPTWNKPQIACLASRIPYGEKITQEKLQMVNEAEEYLRSLGIKQVRVRHHNNLARIEVEKEKTRLFNRKDVCKKIVNKFKEIGYIYVTLDLEGYRTGSMNEVLK
jgi:uncharacterized protein